MCQSYVPKAKLLNRANYTIFKRLHILGVTETALINHF